MNRFFYKNKPLVTIFLILFWQSSPTKAFNFPGMGGGGQGVMPMPMGAPGGGFGSGPGGFDEGAMADMDFDKLFGSMDPNALDQIMAAADQMLKDNPNILNEIESMMGPVDKSAPTPKLAQPKQPTKPSQKGYEDLDEDFYPTPQPAAKKTASKKSSKDSEVDLSSYSGFRRVLMDQKETPMAKNKAFSELLVAFNSAYEKLKGYALMTDTEEAHLLVPVREELLKFLQAEPCQVTAAIITISENYSEKAFSSNLTKMYKELFVILDLLEGLLKKISSFADLHDPAKRPVKTELDEPTEEEVALIDGFEVGSINNAIEVINQNLTEIKKLLTDPKLKTQYEKHLSQKGFKPYQRRSSPYWPKYGKSGSSKNQYSKPSSKSGAGGSYPGYRGGKGSGKYDDYDDYYDQDYKKDLTKADQGQDQITKPKDDRELKEPKKEIADLYNEIAALADMRIFDPDSKKLIIEKLYSSMEKIFTTLIEQKSMAQELALFISEIFDLKISGAEEKKDAKDSQDQEASKGKRFSSAVAKPFKDSFVQFSKGLESLAFVAQGQLPYTMGNFNYFPGLIENGSQYAKDLTETISQMAEEASSNPFSMPTGTKSSQMPYVIIEKFTNAITQASSTASAMKKTLADLSKRVSAIKKTVAIKEASKPSEYSLGSEFRTLDQRIESAMINIQKVIASETVDLNSFTAIAPQGFFDGLTAQKEDDWKAFKATNQIKIALVALGQLLVKYKVQCPYNGFKRFDSDIKQSLTKLSDSYEKLMDAFMQAGIGSYNLSAAPLGAAIPAFLQTSGAITDQTKVDATREFLAIIWGSGQVLITSTNPKAERFHTFAYAIKSIATLHDNLLQVVTGQAASSPSDKLSSKIVDKAEQSLRTTYTNKTSITDLAKKVGDWISSAAEDAAGFLAKIF